MNKNETMKQIADSIQQTFQECYFKPFESKREQQTAIKEFAKRYIDVLKEECSANNYIIKTAKLPRKLKKYYKKTVGVLPIEIYHNYQLENWEIEVAECLSK